VFAAFELLLAKKLGVPSSKIIFNGPGKSDSETEMIIDEDIALVNADSIEELERIGQIAKAKGKIVDVGIRVKQDIPDFIVGQKFGMDIATGQAFKAYQRASELENLNTPRFYCHISISTPYLPPFPRISWIRCRDPRSVCRALWRRRSSERGDSLR